jgi:hypothetical protein
MDNDTRTEVAKLWERLNRLDDKVVNLPALDTTVTYLGKEMNKLGAKMDKVAWAGWGIVLAVGSDLTLRLLVK